MTVALPPIPTVGAMTGDRQRDGFKTDRRTAPPRNVEKGHVWTAPAVQEESDGFAKRSGAAMYPAFECGRYGRWP